MSTRRNTRKFRRDPRRWNTFTFTYRRKLVERYDGVAKLVARKFSYVAAYDDLLQEGRLALAVAARHFDPGRGARFGPFARTLVERRIFDFVSRQTPVHIGTNATRRSLVTGRRACCTRESPCERCVPLEAARYPVEIDRNHSTPHPEHGLVDRDLRRCLAVAIGQLEAEDRVYAELIMAGDISDIEEERYVRIVELLRDLMGVDDDAG